MKTYWLVWPLLCLLSLFGSHNLRAEQNELATPSVQSEENSQSEFERAMQAMQAAGKAGPLDIPLLDQATLALPQGYVFVANPAAKQFMEAIGNRVGDGFLGLILPNNDKGDWLVVASFDNSGYVRDAEAKEWKVDELLEQLRHSTEEMNKTRASRGTSELEVVGWAESPVYDEQTHRLVWSLAVREKGAAMDSPQSVNYNTYALGRDGYISLNLVTALDTIEQRKHIAQTLLASLDYIPGKRYADFNADTDHMAEYGVAALIGGVAAKKLGLFAMLGVFLVKFGKIIAISALGLFGLFGKRLGGKKRAGDSSMEA